VDVGFYPKGDLELSREQTISVASDYDAGLRTYMTGVYNRMGLGLLLTAVLAYLASIDPLKGLLFTTTNGKLGFTVLGLIVQFAPLVIILASGFMRGLQGSRGSAILFYSVAALFGLSLGTIFLLYTGASIALTFVATTAAFGGLSLWGYVTKRDLSGMGVFLIMALIGLIVAMLINMFVQSSAMDYLISGIGVLVFAGFIAYDTQTIKLLYNGSMGGEEMATVQNHGALNLYLDFINMFLFLLRFMGVKLGDD
jgi:hypothetical protein